MKKMRKINIEIPDNRYHLSFKEIAVIQAAIFYIAGDDTMTKEAQNVCMELGKYLNQHKAVGTFDVWK